MFRVYENRENIPDPNDVSDALITGVKDEVRLQRVSGADNYHDLLRCVWRAPPTRP